MQTCKNCIHYDLCKYNAYQEAKRSGKSAEKLIYINNNIACKFFKDISRIIEPPCKVGDKVAVKALCECVQTIPDHDECRYICPFEDDCECDDCDNANERIFNTEISSIFNNGLGWKITFKDLFCIEADFTDIGVSFFVGENAEQQAKEALAEMAGDAE